MSKCKNNCCCNCSCNSTPVCGPLYQMNQVRMAPVCMPVAQNTAPSYMPMPSYNNGGCNRNGSSCGGFGGGGICTLLIFLLILGNTGLLENRNALTLILLFWCCGGFGCGNNRSCGCGY